MMTTQRLSPWLAVLAGWTLSTSAAVPAPEQLLPADTLAVLAVPDFAKVRAAQKQSAMALLWDDPAMKPFRDKLMNQLQKEIIEPLEKELGIKLQDYANLAQGQVTAALTQSGWTGTVDPLPGLLILVDSRDKKDQLQKSMETARQKVTDAGQKVRSERVRDLEFMVVTLDPETVKEALDADDPAPKVEVAIGQADSLLVVATNLKDAEKVVARLAGGNIPCLADQSAFQGNATAMFRDALSYGWIHFAPLAEVINQFAREAAASATPGVPPADKLMDAFGLNGLKTLAFAARHSTEGDAVDLLLGAPEAGRKGLFRLIATEAKDAAPPAFVPADAVTFNRWRLDGQRFWGALEAMVNDIAPGGLQGAMEMINEVAKQKDPGFDLKKSLVGNLGDDLVSYAKAPRGTTLGELAAQPSIFLLGSPRAEQLVQAIRSLINGVASNPMLPVGGELKERDFLGRKIYSMDLPPSGGPAKALMMTASGGYVAFGTDSALIEEYLRSGDSKPKPLTETAGFRDAAAKVGGTGTGLFGFQNDKESMRPMYEAFRANNDLLSTMFGEVLELDEDGGLKNWLDFSLLPPFERVAKYFGISVFAGSQTRDGYLMKVFTPMPTMARQ